MCSSLVYPTCSFKSYFSLYFTDIFSLYLLIIIIMYEWNRNLLTKPLSLLQYLRRVNPIIQNVYVKQRGRNEIIRIIGKGKGQKPRHMFVNWTLQGMWILMDGFAWTILLFIVCTPFNYLNTPSFWFGNHDTSKLSLLLHISVAMLVTWQFYNIFLQDEVS